MPSQHLHHILTLHLYQPPGGLAKLLLESEAELQRILKCYERIARHADKYADVARLHVVFSVPLLQQLRDPAFISRTRHLEDVPGILESFRRSPNIEFIASGVQHAPLPLIPPDDWDAQLRTERSTIEACFGHRPRGYYPPGGLFDEAMIPHLTATGYRFVLLPSTALIDSEGRPVDPYRVYHLKDDFAVVPIDNGFSDAQAHFIEAPWFADEVINGTRVSPEPASSYLVTTCSDGENGEWFRRSDEENGFFGRFFAPYMEFCETGEYPICPVNVVEFLRQAEPEPAFLAKQERPHRGHPAFKQLEVVSGLFWEMTRNGVTIDPVIRERLLQAEGSCFVLDQDAEYEKLTGLLDSIHQELRSQKTGAARNAGKKGVAAALTPPVRTPPSTQPSQRKVPAEVPDSKPKGYPKSARPAGSQSANETNSAKRTFTAKKTAAAVKKQVKTSQSIAPKGTKDKSE